MKVKDAIRLLQQCDPEAVVIVEAPEQGTVYPVTLFILRDPKGERYSFENIPTVQFTYANLEIMQKKGANVLWVEEST